MTSHHPSEVDSVASSPRSDHSSFDQHTRVRFMCSFGGKILPRPHDNQLRYVGGDTRIVAVHRSTNFSILLAKLSKLSGVANVTVKYQLPNEDLDALISVTTDEDVENMMEEYDRVAQSQNPRSARLRLFLFQTGDSSRASSISSLLGGSANRDHWFLDALNAGGSALERGRSEASSILSELPDYLFGLDNSDDPKMKTRNLLADNVSNSDPGSPAPALSSPFCSASSVSCVPPIPNLPPVKTKPDNPEPVVQAKENQIEGFAEAGGQPTSQPTGCPGNPVMQYIQDSRYQGHAVQPIQVYYVPGPVPPGNVSVQPVAIPAPYSQQYHAVSGQLPLGYHHAVPGMSPLYGGGMRPGVAQPVPFDPYDVQSRVVQDGVNQQVFYGVRNSGMVPVYPNMAVPGGEDSLSIGSEIKTGRASQ
ncbi:uncharacterized protein LOC132172004 [Corylus avellana]|uniref:uncharacterized protein LOC132172004 n=1 Tax=Corylus avellana TaxID=13451 RepID=UPI00286AC505|nr:uncharacterized protein LOC132172004 [Corylus avellana]XP_059439406.1 uncharacterized protein LOC132172004 [Corylus avellana]